MSARSTHPPSNDSDSNSVFLVHKPLAVLCSKHDESKDLQRGPTRETMYELAEENGFPGFSFNLVGRLDADTSGLILFTNNLRLMNAINHPLRSDLTTEERELMLPFKEKEYVAIVRPDKSVLKQWRENGADSFNPAELEIFMSRPFSFDYKGEHFEVDRSRVEFVKRYSDSKYTYGRPDLMGWCIEIRINIAEGKHHQIRR
jgi:16S rRNA U516 pseudouridylate synthase RsuA-like enzyme